MGTQQILLIVLSVIIVGIAVAVGITMFNAQATNSNRQAVIADLNNFGSNALAYYKTPASHGGGEKTMGGNAGDDLGKWLGFGYVVATNTLTTGNGTFVLSIAGGVATIVGTGTELGNDGTANVNCTMTATGSTSVITMVINN